MPRSLRNGIAEINSPHTAEESRFARTHSRETRMGLETIRCRIEERFSRLANVLLNRSGKFWQEDYYDTLIRDEAHLKRAIRYTEQNPVKAFLAKAAREWPWSSARHRDKYEHLPWQRSE
jgi:hypothetical protein